MDVLNITGYQRRTPHVVAECKGFFAKEQLELNFHRTTFAPDHNRGMAEGRWDFTLSSADTMTVLKKDLGTGLELLADVLTQPTFPQSEIDRQKQAIIATIRATEENPGAVAGKAFAAALFPQSPYGRPVEGTEASVKALQQKNLQDFFARYYRPNRSIIAVVGDVSEQEIASLLETALRSWSKGEPSAVATAPVKIGPSKLVRVNKDLTQANIVMGHSGVARGNPDYYAIQVMPPVF